MYCIKLHDSGKLQTREDTCSQVNQYKNHRRQGRSQERFGRLAGWLDGWDHGKASDKITDTAQIGKGLAETIPETDNNSLQVERKVTL